MLTSLDAPSPAAVDTAATAGRWSQRSPRWSVLGLSVSLAAEVCSARPGGRRKQHTRMSFTLEIIHMQHKCSMLPPCISLSKEKIAMLRLGSHKIR